MSGFGDQTPTKLINKRQMSDRQLLERITINPTAETAVTIVQ
ncbi:hypothetical protein [Okeania sp. SIO2C2]|nr:hypothetical protein [Okeania sp. SIO2C2]